jgi:hypothetical protein
MANTDSHSTNDKHDSPLLALPAEIRNEIYAYVFGGKAITMDHGPCRHVLSRKVFTPERVYGTIAPRMVELWLAPCEDIRPAYTLALLETCRQIYAEAHTLPFELNAFLFADVRTLELLAESATMAARIRLVQTIRLQGVDNFGWSYVYRQPGVIALASQLMKPKVVEVVDAWEVEASQEVDDRVQKAREDLEKDIVEVMGSEVEIKYVTG